ncbi:hypothetical protein FACS1894211_11630 [Clostridia bacterium]|nr:hypothetical protein FACS1894211_11630 [Clostridia bacterium]
MIRSNLVRYINRYYDGKASGFLLSISEKKRSGFQFNAKEIKRTLYRKEYQLRREQKARKTRTQEVIAERKHKKNLKTDYREAVRQGLIAAGVPGEKAETNTRFLSELVIKNCSHAAKSPEQVKESSIAAAVAVETKTKTPEKSKPKQQGKRK